MFEWLFGKSRYERLQEETKKSFEAVKNDVSNVGVWIKHLENEDRDLKQEISDIKDILTTMQNDVEGLKSVIDLLGNGKNKQVFKTQTGVYVKQTSVGAVQTGVQTGVQTPNLDQFSVSERALIWVLLNYDGSLSYEDLAVMLGKEKSTIRGQINTIRQKNPGLIEESVEKSGRKRVFIPEEIKEKLLKRTKVRFKGRKSSEKIEK